MPTITKEEFLAANEEARKRLEVRRRREAGPLVGLPAWMTESEEEAAPWVR